MKIDLRGLWKKRKKPIIAGIALVLAASIGCGIWYYAGHSSKEPVYVYPFEYIGMTEYWGDSQESYGPVTTDKIQTIFLTDTQTVTEILVQPGDTVKKGDLLMTFDTTLSDLALERKRLDVEKLKLQLQDAKDELGRINSMKPMVIPEITEEEDTGENENLGRQISSMGYELSTQKSYDGSTPEKALICWIRGDMYIDDGLLAAIQAKAEEYQGANVPEETDPPETSEPEETDPPETSEPEETDPPETSEPEETDPPETSEPEETDPPETSEPEETDPPETSEPEETDPPETSEPEETDPPETQPTEETQSGEPEPSEEQEQSSASAVTPVEVDSFYVVFRATEGNYLLGAKTLWQGMYVKETDSGYQFRFVDAVIPDHMAVSSGGDGDVSAPSIDFGSGYTAAQIAQMRSEQEKKIKQLQFDIKMAEADYKIAQTEMSDGNVYAEIDGEVVSVLTEEEAKQTQQPVVKVSGGGGFYVEGFVSELEKDKMQIGQEVTVNDWNTGMVYTGTVDSLGDFPAANGYWNGMGNPNASYYPFMVFVDGSADLQAGRYVNVTYSAGTSEHGVYLENPFLRTENGRSYVLVLGEDGRLEQRFVTTGKSLWGSYTEILEGVTPEDLIAFPYGKNVKPGVKAEEGDMSNLYG